MPLRLDHSPQVHPTAFIAPGAVVLGDVTLDEEASVWYGAVLRADTDAIRVGARSNVQDGVVIHVDAGDPCIIGADVTVGHRAVIHGATVEDGCLIGMGAIILNGAVIGAGSIIGAGAVVREREQVPPRSLVVGVPGRVVRQLSDEQVAVILVSAAHYVEYSRAYADRGRKTTDH